MLGRFINADAFTSTGQGLLGNNMFAYCANNPVLLADATGMLCEISAGGGGAFTNPYPTVSLWKIIKDEINNDDIQEALDDDALNFYKGVPILEIPGMGDASFSFGMIFMGDDAKDPTLLRHEYGHVVQLQKLGIMGYTQFVVFPSVAGFWATEVGPLSWDDYYNLPWENIADRFGGVDGSYAPGATTVADIYWAYVSCLNSLIY